MDGTRKAGEPTVGTGPAASTDAGDFFAAVREELLALLAREDGLTIAELPREWPVTRLHVRYAVFELVELGFVEKSGEGAVPGQDVYRPTPRGLRHLAALRSGRSATAA